MPVKVAPPLGEGPESGGDLGMQLEQPARRYAVTAPFASALSLADDQPLVVQYEVQLGPDGLQCGGAYVKLYEAPAEGAAPFDVAAVTPSTPYAIMFGPDRCGGTDRVHFIIRWRNPVSGAVEEKHAGNVPKARSDKVVHLYTLTLRPDATFSIAIDGKVETSGSLAVENDFQPPVLPPAEIDDPSDSKPADWVDAEKIADPAAAKPEDWDEDAPETIEDAAAVRPTGWLEDEPDMVADPLARKPEDWDDEEDGVWAAPTVANPKCESAPGCGVWRRPTKRNPAFKGKWRAPLIANPAYVGKWKPRLIANPAFFTDAHLNRLGGARMSALGVEVWTMQGGITFDNVLVTRSEAAAAAFAEATFRPKHDEQAAAVARAEAEAERERLAKAAESGGVLDRIALLAAQVAALARAHQAEAVGVAVVVLLMIVAGFWALCGCCAEEPKVVKTTAVPRRPAAAAAAAAAGAADNAGAGSGAGAEDEADEREEGEDEDEDEDEDESKEDSEVLAKAEAFKADAEAKARAKLAPAVSPAAAGKAPAKAAGAAAPAAAEASSAAAAASPTAAAAAEAPEEVIKGKNEKGKVSTARQRGAARAKADD
jgi:calnexin